MRMIQAIYLKVGATAYSGLASEVKVPGVPAEVWEGSTDDNLVADVPVGKRQLTLTARQDWEDPTGLCQFLADQEGQSAAVVYSLNPTAETPAYFTVDAVLSAPDQGGKLNSYGEFTISFPCSKPTRTTAPA